MDNYVEELNKRIENLYERINKTKNILIVYNLIENGDSNYQHIFLLPGIINKNMQSGNYRRATIYLFFTERLMDEIEKNSTKIKKKITDYMLKD